MIRTLAEVRADNVTITVSVDDAPSTVRKICNWCPEGTWDDRFHPDGASHVRLYTAAEVGDAQASEAELVAAPLRQRIEELERTLAESRDLVAFKDKIRADVDRDNIKLREKVRELAAQVREYDRDRTTERDRADRMTAQANRLETERAELETHHRMSLATRDRLLEAATRKNKAAVEILTADSVAQARGMDCSRLGATMADAIGNALRVLDPA